LDLHEKVMQLATRRGFLWPSYEIYGGLRGFYDYGPLGASVKKRIEDAWRRTYCVGEGFLEISSPTVGPEEVYLASGHLENFVDPMVECLKCRELFRADHLLTAQGVSVEGLDLRSLDEKIRKASLTCPECGGELGEVWSYNLMFKTHIGPGNKKVGYLRPETAQGIFILFHRLYAFYRKRLPFGVAQIGRAYRNEISPRQGVIRLREFTQAEVEVFVHPEEKRHEGFSRVKGEKLTLVPREGGEEEWTAQEAVKEGKIAHELLAYHLLLAKHFLEEIGIPGERIRFRQHLKTEMAHYAADCWDVEVLTDRFGWIEVVGIADRTDYDLKAHREKSGAELSAFLHYPEPRIHKKEVLEPKMEKIGPTFRERAGAVLEALHTLGNDGVEAFRREGSVSVVVNGETIRLDGEHLTPKTVEETVSGERFIPHVIEPSYGIDRIFYCILESAYREVGGRTFLAFRNSVVPIDVAVFPLTGKDPLPSISRSVNERLRAAGLLTLYDESDSIGRRYARVDEIGVPYAVTIDFETPEEETATVRQRDTTQQKRVPLSDLVSLLRALLTEEKGWEDLPG
jgi:glycyl-tRNA synthetase